MSVLLLKSFFASVFSPGTMGQYYYNVVIDTLAFEGGLVNFVQRKGPGRIMAVSLYDIRCNNPPPTNFALLYTANWSVKMN